MGTVVCPASDQVSTSVILGVRVHLGAVSVCIFPPRRDTAHTLRCDSLVSSAGHLAVYAVFGVSQMTRLLPMTRIHQRSATKRPFRIVER